MITRALPPPPVTVTRWARPAFASAELIAVWSAAARPSCSAAPRVAVPRIAASAPCAIENVMSQIGLLLLAVNGATAPSE